MQSLSIYIPPESYVLPRVSLVESRFPGISWHDKVDLVLSSFQFHPEFETFCVSSLAGIRDMLIGDADELSGSTGEIISIFYRWLASGNDLDSQWVGDKTPLNTLNLGLVYDLLPSSCFLYIERDPVDVVHSYVQSGIYKSYREAAARWIDSKKCWSRFCPSLPRDRQMSIKYENLVQDPDSTISGIASYFGIPCRDASIDVATILGDVGMRPHHQHVLMAVSRGSVGKGRQCIDYRDRVLLDSLLAEELAASGYEPLI